MTQELSVNPAPKLLAAIIDRNEAGRLEKILTEKHAHFHYMFHAMGTASSEILKAFGLSGTEKTVCLCIETAFRIGPLMTAIVERMELTRPGNGIAFVIPISGVSAAVSHVFSKQLEALKERWMEYMDKEAESALQDLTHELVIAVINQGYSENVMDVARGAGARGGTIVHARRSGVEDAAKFFGISLQAEKEIVAILVPKCQKKELMQELAKACGMKTDAHGIIVSLPVQSCAGIDGVAWEE